MKISMLIEASSKAEQACIERLLLNTSASEMIKNHLRLHNHNLIDLIDQVEYVNEHTPGFARKAD